MTDPIELLDAGEIGGIYLDKIEKPAACISRYDRKVWPGQWAVLLRSKGVEAWVSISGVDDLAMALERFNGNGAELYAKVVDNGSVKVIEAKHSYALGKYSDACVACGNSVTSDDLTIRFQTITLDGYNRDVCCHFDCTAEVVEALDQVWEHSEELLPQAV